MLSRGLLLSICTKLQFSSNSFFTHYSLLVMKNKKILFLLSGFFVAVSVMLFFVPNFVQADSNYGLDDTASAAQLPMNTDLAATLGNILGSALSLISVLFFGLMLYGGITWMIARGKTENTQKALDTIIAAIIGIVIVLAAYAITNFVFSNISSGPVTPPPPPAAKYCLPSSPSATDVCTALASGQATCGTGKTTYDLLVLCTPHQVVASADTCTSQYVGFSCQDISSTCTSANEKTTPSGLCSNSKHCCPATTEDAWCLPNDDLGTKCVASDGTNCINKTISIQAVCQTNQKECKLKSEFTLSNFCSNDCKFVGGNSCTGNQTIYDGLCSTICDTQANINVQGGVNTTCVPGSISLQDIESSNCTRNLTELNCDSLSDLCATTLTP